MGTRGMIGSFQATHLYNCKETQQRMDAIGMGTQDMIGFFQAPRQYNYSEPKGRTGTIRKMHRIKMVPLKNMPSTLTSTVTKEKIIEMGEND